MAVTWTKEQKQVIDSRDKSLLVSAAAGSGKTAVLVARIIAKITDLVSPVDIDITHPPRLYERPCRWFR